MKNYIGLACTMHDPAIAIVDSKGEVRFAEATERYMQNKRAFGCPPDDINRVNRLIEKYCEPSAEIVVAKTWSVDWVERDADDYVKDESAALKKASEEAPDELKPGVRFLENFWGWMQPAMTAARTASIGLTFRIGEETPGFPDTMTIRRYNHHLTHAAAACYTSPFSEALCAVMDGFGEGTANTFYHYKSGRLVDLMHGKSSRASLGFYYWHLCYACGFDGFKGEEWKVMGLAAYGKLNQEIYDLLRPMFEHDGLCVNASEDYVARLTKMIQMRKGMKKPLDAADLAFTGQAVFCDVAKILLGELHALGKSNNLVIGGGCALNSAWNGQVLNESNFEKLYIPSAPADDGNALGAALLAYYEDNPPKESRKIFTSPFLGEEASPKVLERAVSIGGLKNQLPDGKTVPEFVAELLAAGNIVGWFQGRAEWGPRALGNRSILADPRDVSMKEKINSRVKFREEYRPFAPAILHEHGEEYFEDYQETPYMERALRFRPDAREKVPAVYHEDGTGRLQTVKAEWNGAYHSLISEFYKLTGVPVILNTSFNIMGKPIVHSVEDALACFYTTGIDVLVIEDMVFLKNPQ